MQENPTYLSSNSYHTNRTSCYDFKEMDEKYGLSAPEKNASLNIQHRNFNCGLLKEITGSRFYSTCFALLIL